MFYEIILEQVRYYRKIEKAQQIEIARNLNITRKDDYIWCYIRDAECYMQVSVAGRRYINDLIHDGYAYEPFEMAVDHFYGNDLVDFNREADFWHIIFSPIAENEDKPKIWIKFPNTNELIWFFIEDYNEKDGFYLSPNPRMKGSVKLFDKNGYGEQFDALVRENPISIKYAMDMCEEYFERHNVIRPSDSRLCYNGAFLVHPMPEKKAGDGTNMKVPLYSRDFF